MDFIVDEMLKGLIRWLRILGFNTLEIISLSREEYYLFNNYYYLTGSPKHYDLWNNHKKILLKENKIDSQLQKLNSKLGIFSELKPFSRCSICNNILLKATKEELVTRIPPGVAKNINRFFICPTCLKIYWHGGHVKRMLDKLRRIGVPIDDN